MRSEEKRCRKGYGGEKERDGKMEGGGEDKESIESQRRGRVMDLMGSRGGERH